MIIKNKLCVWCGKRAWQHNHHYPVQKNYGGTKTVKICIKCHNLYHIGILINTTNCKNDNEENKKICKVLKKCFPKLKAIVNPKVITINTNNL